jgi:two-component system, OmpR family, sensor histidine kinase CreC
MSIRLQIITGFLLIVAAGFFYLTRWVLEDIRPHYLKSMEESLVDQATILASLLSTQSDTATPDLDLLRAGFDHASKRRFEARIYDVVKTRTNVRVYVTDSAGIVRFDSENGADEGADYSEWNDVARTLRGAYGARATRGDADDPLSASLYVCAPVLRAGKIAGALSVAKPIGSVDQFVLQARGKIIAAGAVAAGGVVVLGVVLSMWVTLPIRRLTAYARAVRDGRKAAPPRLGGETAVMGAALEEMKTALEGKAYVEQYVQSLTHELKSPVAAIRGAAELLQGAMSEEDRGRFLRNIERESGRLQEMVDRMLELASLESRRALRDVEEVEISGLVEEVVDALRAPCEARGVTVSFNVREDCAVRGERFLLRQALTNLLQNAVEFSPDGGSVRVAVTAGRDGARVTVEDNGPGIPLYALDKVFDRFYSLPRPATGRKSSGLGLAFVRQAVELHGGSVELRNKPERGARAELVLPTAS